MIVFAKVVRDLCLVAAGLIGAFVTPPSLVLGNVTGLFAGAWAAAMFWGALASMYGVLRGSRVAEIYGCTFVGAAFAVWAVLILISPERDLTSVQVALVFIAGTAGQIYRAAMVAGVH